MRLPVWMAFVGLVTAGASCAPSSEDAEQNPTGDALSETLGLDHSEIVVPRFRGDPSGEVRVFVPIAGAEREIVLTAVSIRSNGFQLFIQGDDGSLSQVEAPPSQAVRGQVAGLEGSLVTGAWMADGLHARIALAPDEVYWTEPVKRFFQSDSEHYVLYRDEDVIDIPQACGLNDAIHAPIADTSIVSLEASAAQAEGLAVVEVAADADFEFFQTWGSVDNSVARIESIIAAMNLQYEPEVGITHVLSAAIVRTSEADPYQSTDPITMLESELRPEWLENRGDIARDVVHLFTGKDLDGSTIGIAYVGVICGSFAFGLSQSTFTTNFACVTDLTAHEIGHNWSASHCDCPSFTMNPFLTCSNTFDPDATVPSIVNHRDTRSCLDFGDACPDDPDKVEPGQCGCDIADTDTDLDGVADCVDGCPADGGKSDPGQCGCGVPDVHSDGDGVADCVDGCPADGNKTDPGQCGCGIADLDSDGDGVADCVDGCPADPTRTDASQCDGPVCGDGTCDPGESSCNCPADCGSAPSTETACGDGVDNDCDGATDCGDADCAGDNACGQSCLADGISCSEGADCCSGKCGGPRANRTCRSAGGNGGGADQCGAVGDSCKNNRDCCARECTGPGGGRTCQEPPAGALESTRTGDGDEPSEAGSSLVGGCSVDGGRGPSGALWLVLCALVALRRRGRSSARRH